MSAEDITATPMKARPTTYKGVRMRSRLEAGFAQWCDEIGLPWEYEPECFATEEGQYLPDFLLPAVWVLWEDIRLDLYVEVKPGHLGAEHEALFDRWSRIIKATKPESLFTVIWPSQSGYDFPWVATPQGPALGRRLPQPWQGEWWKGPVR